MGTLQRFSLWGSVRRPQSWPAPVSPRLNKAVFPWSHDDSAAERKWEDVIPVDSEAILRQGDKAAVLRQTLISQLQDNFGQPLCFQDIMEASICFRARYDVSKQAELEKSKYAEEARQYQVPPNSGDVPDNEGLAAMLAGIIGQQAFDACLGSYVDE